MFIQMTVTLRATFGLAKVVFHTAQDLYRFGSVAALTLV